MAHGRLPRWTTVCRGGNVTLRQEWTLPKQAGKQRVPTGPRGRCPRCPLLAATTHSEEGTRSQKTVHAGVPSFHPEGPPGRPPRRGTGTPPARPQRGRAGPFFRGRRGPRPAPGPAFLSPSRWWRPQPPHPLRGVETASEDTPAWASQSHPQNTRRHEGNVRQPWDGEGREAGNMKL